VEIVIFVKLVDTVEMVDFIHVARLSSLETSHLSLEYCRTAWACVDVGHLVAEMNELRPDDVPTEKFIVMLDGFLRKAGADSATRRRVLQLWEDNHEAIRTMFEGYGQAKQNDTRRPSE
jgi:hypothetical protein